jgi:hypothetical protein
VDEFFDLHYQQGWTQIPAGVHHAIGEAGRSGIDSGASGGLGGEISAIVPAYPGQIVYASPTSAVSQDSFEQPPYGTDANGGHASFISTISPTTFYPTTVAYSPIDYSV